MLGVSAVLWFLPDARRWLFAALLVVGVGLELRLALTRRAATRPRLLLGALALMATAFALWALDETLVLCDPSSVLQGHAAWHVLGAAALVVLSRYYTGEATRS